MKAAWLAFHVFRRNSRIVEKPGEQHDSPSLSSRMALEAPKAPNLQVSRKTSTMERDSGIPAPSLAASILPHCGQSLAASGNCIWVEMRSSLSQAISRLPEPLRAVGGGMNNLVKGYQI